MDKEMNGEERTKQRKQRRVLLVASLLALCLPQETNLSADYTCTFISIYIKYNKV